MRQWKTILHHGKTCISIKVLINLHISFSDAWQLLRTHMLVVFGPKFCGPGPQCRQARPTYLTLMSSGKHFQMICNLQALWVQLNSSAKWWSTLALAHRIHHQSAAPSPRYTLGGQKSHDSFVVPCRHFCGIVNSVQLGETMIESKPPCDDMITCKQRMPTVNIWRARRGRHVKYTNTLARTAIFLIVAAVIGFEEIIITVINNNMCRPGSMEVVVGCVSS